MEILKEHNRWEIPERLQNCMASNTRLAQPDYPEDVNHLVLVKNQYSKTEF